MILRMRVVFPTPLRPMTHVTQPLVISMLMPRSVGIAP